MMPREPKLTRIRRRTFTREQDEWIVLQSQGKVTTDWLEKMTHACRETLARRAQELGVEFRVRHRDPASVKRYSRHRKSRADEVIPSRVWCGDHGGNPCSVGEDELLKRLHAKHGKRRYEVLQIPATKQNVIA